MLKTNFIYACVAILIVTCTAVTYFNQKKDDSFENANEKGDYAPREIDWNILKGLNYKTGRQSEEITKLSGSRVKIAGFLIPLEDNLEFVQEFLFVPSPMACIHVPPPPPNQVIHVKMASGRKAKMSYGPIWLTGRIRVLEVIGPYGKSSFQMVGETTSPYH
ncbi:MAG: DUF3299 domain-containing protein [Silvanigrellaceae bacterium]|nr:DUF3299 domain-containing protein [Silvanigrellaceae bacterium]